MKTGPASLIFIDNSILPTHLISLELPSNIYKNEEGTIQKFYTHQDFNTFLQNKEQELKQVYKAEKLAKRNSDSNENSDNENETEQLSSIFNTEQGVARELTKKELLKLAVSFEQHKKRFNIDQPNPFILPKEKRHHKSKNKM